MPDSSAVDAWRGLIDDAAIFPPGNAQLSDAETAHARRAARHWTGPLVGSLVVRDRDLAALTTKPPLSVVLTEGAGGLAGACAVARRRGLKLAGLEIAILDRDDPAANARRVHTAYDDACLRGLLPEGTTLFVELPPELPGSRWLRAADVVADAGHRLKFRTGGVEAHLFPDAVTLTAWIDAALDRETSFKCTAGLHHALRHRAADTGFEHHGFLNVLTATLRAWEGATPAEVAETLEDRALVPNRTDLTLARRWFTSFGSCSVDEPVQDLIDLGLLRPPGGP